MRNYSEFTYKCDGRKDKILRIVRSKRCKRKQRVTSMVVTGNGKNCTDNSHSLNTQECSVWHEGLRRSLGQHTRVKLI